MEYSSNLSQSFANRVESQYNDINENINRLIDQLGLKVHKQMINIQERALLRYKDSLLQTQNNFKNLKEARNDESIKQNILTMKMAQQKAYQQSSQKSLQANKIYDKLKIQLKRTAQYERQLQLQLKFLSKQSKLAKAKSESLQAEIKQCEERRNKQIISTLQNSQNLTKANKQSLCHKKTDSMEIHAFENRVKSKIEHLKQFITFMNEQKSTMENIFTKYDFESFKSQRQKAYLFELVFEDKEFKKFIYHILFGKKMKQSAN